MVSQQTFTVSRRFLARVLSAIALMIAVLVPTFAEAKGSAIPRKFAGIVIDAKSGKVLYESAADSLRFPASVTKVMTLYVLFQELAAGNVKLTDQMKVSKYAASAVPTKLGLKAGKTISVENAIEAIVTISANDMARVIAEHISGSEGAFARRMTATAHALGMRNTNYHNASGLPDPQQTTTVRDQAILGMAIYEHFPKYYAYFQTRSFAYGKRVYGNHNRLLGSNGVDGIKTGYTNASGFNLLTAARKDGRHIVVAGFGFDSSGKRDSKVRELVKTYLPKGRRGDYLEAALVPRAGRQGEVVQVATAAADPVFPMPYPAFRQDNETDVASVGPEIAVVQPLDASVQLASVEAPAPARRPKTLQPPTAALQAANQLGGEPDTVFTPETDVIGAWISDTFELGAAPAPLGETRPSAPLLPPVGIGDEGQPVDPTTSGSITPVEVATAAPAEEQPPSAEAGAAGWIVQIGAAPTESGAHGLLTNASAKVGTLGERRSYVERFEKNGQTFYRARFTGFGDKDDAANACNELKKAKMSCLAMQG